MNAHRYCILACLAITGVAAVTDARTGRIPNWLTLPPLVLGPVVWAISGGFVFAKHAPLAGSMVGSLVSLLACAVPALVLWKANAMEAGDVKLFAALGALGLWQFGLEAFGYSLFVLTLYALGRMAWEGKLFRLLGNTMFLMINPVLPRKYKREIHRETLVKMRFGPSIFGGTLVAALANNQIHGFL